ncbi:uncharacterized protein LOC126234788 isoform X1 [Schistocerca nitens]|uniref:uncharacterized protein LOC126234788 isoform X1 n=1 Tax=Schistocerca nitens TaxID=7011 RepID=UPI0021174B85|nr:uncharacterized protein LOC126234788 isoform X1 [Schistocerca nitens]
MNRGRRSRLGLPTVALLALAVAAGAVGAAALPTSLLEDASAAAAHQQTDKGGEAPADAGSASTAAPGAAPEAAGSGGRASVSGDGKTVAQYEKGYLYGAGKAAPDKHVENALLKSELYGDPSAVNQYRYYGGANERRPDGAEGAFAPPSKRSSSFRPMVPHALELSGVGPRLKRDLAVDPEDVLALLQLWQAERHGAPRVPSKWSRYGSIEGEEYPQAVGNENEEMEEDDSNNGEWLEGPVYSSALGPHYAVDRRALYIPDYSYQVLNPFTGYQVQPDKRDSRWNGYSKDKRFMVSRKRDVTQPARGDIHYLAQLLGPSHRDQQIPLFHRVAV